MEVLAQISFGMYALIILGGGLMAVGSTSLVRALVGLIFTLFGVAGMYLLLNAAFMAFMQLLIYVGAVCVLIFFALMLARGETASPTNRQCLFGFLAGVVPAALVSFLIIQNPAASHSTPVEVSLAELGKGLMNEYLLAFELISVVLMVAMSGAVLLAWERRTKK